MVLDLCVSLLCRAAHSSENAFCPKAVLQWTGVVSLDSCMNIISSQVLLHWHKPAVSLFCSAEVSSGDAFCPDQCCSALVLGHRTAV